MSTVKREWRTLARRWSTWRWLAFCIVLSFGMHAVVGLLGDLGDLPREALGDPGAPGPASASDANVLPRPVGSKAVSKAATTQNSGVNRDLLKLELADGQLRGVFDSLIGDLLPAEQADALWVRTIISLTPEMNDLADVVADSWSADDRPYQALATLGGAAILAGETLRQPEAKIQYVKERLVEAMTRHLARDRNQKMADSFLRQAREMSQQIAEQYRHDLVLKFGYPAADKLNLLRDKGALARLTNLEFAEAKFTEVAPLARQAAEITAGLDSILTKGVEELRLARAKKDVAGAAKSAAGLRGHRPRLGSAHLMLSKTTNLLRSAVFKVGEMPAIEAYATEALTKFETALAGAYAALTALSNLDGDKVVTAARKSVELSRDAANQADRARAAILIQLVREQADRLHETMSVEARQAGRIAQQKADAEQMNDASKAAAAARAMDLVAREANSAERSLEQIEARLAKAAAAVADAAAAEFKAVQTTLDAAKVGVKLAESALAGRKATDAVKPLQRAAELLGQLDVHLMAVQKKLGVNDEPNPGALSRRQIGKMLTEGKLAGRAKEHFENYYRTAMKERILKKFDAGMNKRVKAEQADPALIESLRGQLDKVFDRELLAQVHADQQVARGLAELLPSPTAQRDVADREDEGTAGAARQVIDVHASYSLPGITISALSNKALYQFSELPYKAGTPPLLLLHMKHVSQQLSAGRREFLGQANLADLAGLRARTAGRECSIFLPGDAVEPANVQPALAMARTGNAADALVASAGRLPAIENSNRLATIPYLANDAIQIDGRLEDWKDVPVIRLDPVLEGKFAGAVKAILQRAWAAHTNRGFLLAVNVVDTTKAIENTKPLATFWLNDAVEVFIDPLNTKYPKCGDGFTHQFFAFPFGHKQDSTSGGFETRPENSESAKWTISAYPPEVIRRAAVKTKAGWSMELFIPKSLLGRGEFRPGRALGFNLQVDTGSDTYYYFTVKNKTSASRRPDIWGDALLLGADATIELLDESGRPLAGICPGRPVRIRVTDPDMNQDDVKRETLGVAIRGDSGSREAVVLEETAPASGIFEGILPTRLKTGICVPGVLAVCEGESATVVYLDRARADGKRDVELTIRFPVCSIGKRVEK